MKKQSSSSGKSSTTSKSSIKWLNSTVLGAGITSFTGDLSYESVTALLPSFLMSIGAPVYALGLIEGFSDGISSFTKLFSGYYSDLLHKRREIATFGYVLNAIFPLFAALASSWVFVLLGKMIAWLGKGLRGPARDAILADSIKQEDLGKAFGFHRAADTLGAVLGPILALGLLYYIGFTGVFYVAAAIGFAGAIAFWVLVKGEGAAKAKRQRSFFGSLHEIPAKFKSFLWPILVFGLSDFSPALFVLLAVTKLTPSMGLLAASGMGVILYTVHNVVYALAAYPFGWLGDKFGRKQMLAFGYFIAVVTFVGFIFAPVDIVAFGLLFALSGVFIAAEDSLESSVAAELTTKDKRGTSFGVLATVNGIGDLVSSSLVGLLWAAYGFPAGLAYSAVLASAGTLMLVKNIYD